MTTLLTGMSAEDFLSIAKSHRKQLDTVGVLVADLAVTRWAAAQGHEYLEIALTEDEPAQFDRVFTALKGVADADEYVAGVDAIARRVVEFGSVTGSARLMTDLAGHVATLPSPAVGRLAPVVGSVQSLADPAPVIAALNAMISASGKPEIPLVTPVTKSFIDAGVTGADALPPALAIRCAGQGTVDLDNLAWLWDHAGASAEEVQTALGAAIQTEPASRIMPALDGLNRTRRKRWGIGMSLVERASKELPGERRIWLEAAKVGNTDTSDRKGREAFRAALDVAAAGDAVDDIVGELRGRLS